MLGVAEGSWASAGVTQTRIVNKSFAKAFIPVQGPQHRRF
jgi:hypothetical protein